MSTVILNSGNARLHLVQDDQTGEITAYRAGTDTLLGTATSDSNGWTITSTDLPAAPAAAAPSKHDAVSALIVRATALLPTVDEPTGCDHTRKLDELRANREYAASKGRIGAPTVRSLDAQITRLRQACHAQCGTPGDQQDTPPDPATPAQH